MKPRPLTHAMGKFGRCLRASGTMCVRLGERHLYTYLLTSTVPKTSLNDLMHDFSLFVWLPLSVRLCSQCYTTVREQLSPVREPSHPHLRKPSLASIGSPLPLNNSQGLFIGIHTHRTVQQGLLTFQSRLLTGFVQCVSLVTEARRGQKQVCHKREGGSLFLQSILYVRFF